MKKNTISFDQLGQILTNALDDLAEKDQARREVENKSCAVCGHRYCIENREDNGCPSCAEDDSETVPNLPQKALNYTVYGLFVFNKAPQVLTYLYLTDRARQKQADNYEANEYRTFEYTTDSIDDLKYIHYKTALFLNNNK